MPTSTFTNLGTFNNDTNPSVSISGTTSAAVASGETAYVALIIPQNTPSAFTVTLGGSTMTQDLNAAKATALNVYLFRINAGSTIASGATFSAAWTAGTAQDGGSNATLFKATNVSSGAPDKTNTGNQFDTSPTTNASGTPSSSSLDYIGVAILGARAVSASGQATPNNSWTAMTESFSTTGRTISIYAACINLTHAVASTTETWTQTWGGSRSWAAAIGLYQLVGAQNLTTTFSASQAQSLPYSRQVSKKLF